jgi:protein-disulfide isomerase
MRRYQLAAVAILTVTFFAPRPAATQSQAPAPKSAGQGPAGLSAAESSAIAKRIEGFLRNEYAWGTDYELKVGPLTSAPAGDLYQTSVQVTAQGGSDSATIYVSKDGRYMFRGDLQDLNQDPLAETRSQLHLENYASKGPANAKVVVVEFADFECPVCRELDVLLRATLPQYPQVRLVFKDFPLETIHPWAMTAAIAGRCALQQSPDAFWKLHDAIYDNQDVISPENAYNKIADLAQQSGVNADAYKTCMADPKTPEAVHASMEEGRSLQVSATPTSFVDGRRLVGPDAALLKQYIEFDQNPHQTSPPASKP